MILPSQPPPKPGQDVVLFHVLQDVMGRAEKGLIIYGTLLETDNGRDALEDALDEAIDLVFYLKQAIMERNQQRIINQRMKELAK
jgi:hypothetical protein